MDIQNLPTRPIVIGYMADGTPLTIEVHSIFGGSK